jgi:hypothetical protein
MPDLPERFVLVDSEFVVLHGVLKKFVVPYRLPDPRQRVFSLGVDFIGYILQQDGIEGHGIPPEEQRIGRLIGKGFPWPRRPDIVMPVRKNGIAYVDANLLPDAVRIA